MSRPPHREPRPARNRGPGLGERRRSESGSQIRWMFSTDQARVTLAKSYPTPLFNES